MPANAVAAPATVSGEPTPIPCHWETGKAGRKATTREPGDLPSIVTLPPDEGFRWVRISVGGDERDLVTVAGISRWVPSVLASRR